MISTGFCLYGAAHVRPATVVRNTPGVYTPAKGSLEFNDVINAATHVLNRGAIMNALMTNPDLNDELLAVQEFDGQGVNLRSYQQIMENLQSSTASQSALPALQAFEKVVMHLYDFRAYALGSYKPGISIFVTGIKWSWINPLSYLNPKNYISDNDPALHQLIDELANIAKVTKIHSVPTAERMNITVNSYRHWRRNIALACALYLTMNACARGWKDSCAKDLKDNGLESIPTIATTALVDTMDATKSLYNGAAYVGCKGYNIVAPCINVLLHGTLPEADKKAKALAAKEAAAKKADDLAAAKQLAQKNATPAPAIITPPTTPAQP